MVVEGIDFSIAIAFFISAAGIYISNRLKLPLPFDFDEIRVKEIVVPRQQIVGLQENSN